MIYGLLSIVIKKRRMLLLISVFAYCCTLFVQTDIYIIQRTLVWGVFFLLGSVLSEIQLDRMDAKKFLLFFIPFDLIYMLAWLLFYEVDSKKDYVSYSNPGLWGIAFVVENKGPRIFDYFSKYGKDSLGIYIIHAPICSMLRILMLKMGINSVFIHVIAGILLGWYLSIFATYIMKKIPILNIDLLPQKYIKLK